MPRIAEKLQCADVELRLGLLADGELSDEAEMNEVRGHVASCADCERAWQRLVGGKRALAALEPDPAPAELLSSIAAMTSAESHRERIRLWAAGAVVVVVTGALWLLTR